MSGHSQTLCADWCRIRCLSARSGPHFGTGTTAKRGVRAPCVNASLFTPKPHFSCFVLFCFDRSVDGTEKEEPSFRDGSIEKYGRSCYCRTFYLQSWPKSLGTPRMNSRASRYVLLSTQVPKFFVPPSPLNNVERKHAHSLCIRRVQNQH